MMHYKGRRVRVTTLSDITERKRTEQDLRASEAKFRSLAEEGLAGVSIIQDGRFKYVNPAMTRMFGYTRDEMLAVSAVVDLVVEEDRASVEERLRLRQEGEIQSARYFFRGLRKDGSVGDMEVFGARIPFDGRFAVMSTVLDVTERKRAEAEREQFFKFFMASRDLMCIAGLDDWFKRVNPAFTRILGYSESELLQTSYLEFILPEDRQMTRDRTQDLMRGGPPHEFENRYRCKDGSIRNLLWMAYFEPADRVIYATAHDISGRRLKEQELRRIAAELRNAYRRLAQAQEAERRALTKELHDQVGQNLSALNLNLHFVNRELSDAERTRLKGRLDACLVLLDETAARVRSVMGNLRPPMLDEFGLYATLRWWAHETTQRSGIVCILAAAEPAQRLPTEMESALLRIAQEALMNAAKYSKAHEIRIALTATPQQVQMEIADDGVGFVPIDRDANVSKPTWGLTTMRERADALGGRVQIISAPGEGTRVVAEIPRA